MFRSSDCAVFDKDLDSDLPVFGTGWLIGGEYRGIWGAWLPSDAMAWSAAWPLASHFDFSSTFESLLSLVVFYLAFHFYIIVLKHHDI